MVTLGEAWERVKMPFAIVLAMVVLTLLIVCIFNPQALRQDYRGVTGNAIRATAACARVYDPVCGTDGTTYENFCRARAAGQDLRHLGACNP